MIEVDQKYRKSQSAAAARASIAPNPSAYANRPASPSRCGPVPYRQPSVCRHP